MLEAMKLHDQVVRQDKNMHAVQVFVGNDVTLLAAHMGGSSEL